MTRPGTGEGTATPSAFQVARASAARSWRRAVSMRRVSARRSAVGRPWASQVRRSAEAGPHRGTSRARPRSASSSAVMPSSPARARRLRSSVRKAREATASGGRPGHCSGWMRAASAASSSAPASRTGAGSGSGRWVREAVRMVRARAAGVRTRTTPPPSAPSSAAARWRRRSARMRVGARRTASLPCPTAPASIRRARLVLPVPGAPSTTMLSPLAAASRTARADSSGSGRGSGAGAGRRRSGAGLTAPAVLAALSALPVLGEASWIRMGLSHHAPLT